MGPPPQNCPVVSDTHRARHLARIEFVEEIQMHPDQDYGVVFRRWGVKYGFIDFLEHFSVPQANGRARCILGNRPVERF